MPATETHTPGHAASSTAGDGLRLSVIVVNWNTADFLLDCLGSLVASTLAPHLEIIVVDNGSTDGSVQRVQQGFPTVRMIANDANVGFGRANNQGLAVARGRYLMLLNSDTRVPPETLPALVTFMDDHPRAGACGPRLVRPDGSPQPFAFGGEPTLGYLARRGLHRLLFRRYLHDWALPKVEAVDWVSGAALLVRHEVVAQVGGLDEAIFLYFEDTDWCHRIRQASWLIYRVPAVSVTHLGGQSVQRNPAASSAYYRSLVYYYRKHYGWPARLGLRLLLPIYRRVA
jgi:GT2 family glycosyltransferase